MTEINKYLIEIARLKQRLTIQKYEIREIQKAVIRHRREFSAPVYVKEFNRKVTLDFDDPLYPYCPYRLTEEELLRYLPINGKGGDNAPEDS